MFGCLADELCREAGVDLYFHPFLADAVVSEDGGAVTAIVVATKSGLKRICGKQFVDATGDGDLSAHAGAAAMPRWRAGGPLQGFCGGHGGMSGGTERVTVTACAPEVAARESRRICCDHRITVQEYVRAAAYPDAVCYSYYPIDLHKAGAESLHNVFLENGVAPTIPLGAMLVKGKENLLAVGRCACGDRLANSAYRVKASCMAMGQAAGAAAALAQEKLLRNIDPERLRTCLEEAHAIVPR